ncbi:hypothetical protein K3495_g9441 [Podosphaera aphanis]|nr:hypothetical protein K3495_g9441 [Podosphaera aphanis]
MSDNFAPPPGPPPNVAPQVPDGYKAQWNEQYNEWFYVNIYTKKSQWNKPTEPAFPDANSAPPGPPPGRPTSDVKTTPSNESDAALAARMQSEEQDKTRGSLGQQPLPPREQKQKTGFFDKLLGKASPGSNTNSAQNYQQPPQYSQAPAAYGYGATPAPGAYGYGQPPPPAPYGWGQPPQYGGYQQPYPPQGYPPQGYNPQPGYPQPGYGAGTAAYGAGYPAQQAKKSGGGGGMGMAGGAALGLGAGLVGGMLLENAIEDHEERIYEQGYQDAQQDDGDFGDDF